METCSKLHDKRGAHAGGAAPPPSGSGSETTAAAKAVEPLPSRTAGADGGGGGSDGIGGIVLALRRLLTGNDGNSSGATARGGPPPVSTAVALLFSKKNDVPDAPPATPGTAASGTTNEIEIEGRGGGRSSTVSAPNSSTAERTDQASVPTSSAGAPAGSRRKKAARPTRTAPIDIPWGNRQPPRCRPRLNHEKLWFYNSFEAGPEEIILGGFPMMFHMDDV